MPVDAGDAGAVVNTPEDRPLTDAELIAVAALAQCEALSMNAENESRVAAGHAPAYATLQSDASCRLDRELRRRGVL